MPVPVTARSKALVCGRLPADIVGSNPTVGMDVSLLWALCVCVVRWRSLRRAYHSSRGVQPTVVSRCVGFRNLVNEGALAHWGQSRQTQTNKVWQCVVWWTHISISKGAGTCTIWFLVHYITNKYTVMRRITTFRSMTDRIYDSATIIL